MYELTDWGRELEPILLALGGWGAAGPAPAGAATLSATSVLLFLRGSVHLEPDLPPATYRLELDDRVWTVRAEAGALEIQPGEPGAPDASLRADATTLNALLEAPGKLDEAVSDGRVVAGGDLPALRRLLQAAA